MSDSQALMAIHLSFLSKGSDDSSPSLVTLGWKPSKWKDAYTTPVFGGDQGGWLPLQSSLGSTFPTSLWALASNRAAGRRQGEPRIKGDAPCWGRIPPFLSLAGVRHCGHLEATLSPVKMEQACWIKAMSVGGALLSEVD